MLSLLKGFFSMHNFSNRENITLALLKDVPNVKYWWKTYYEKDDIEESSMFRIEPTWASFVDILKK